METKKETDQVFQNQKEQDKKVIAMLAVKKLVQKARLWKMTKGAREFNEKEEQQ